MPGTGPLRDVRVVEIAGLGPGPFTCMVLAQLGADVVRIERPVAAVAEAPADAMTDGRPAIRLDLKQPSARETVLRLTQRADVLVEGFRPGVMERLGLGPEVVCSRNPALVYGRVTGYGQDGPLAQAAGHDINYLALTGVLAATARRGERPMFPLNLLGDFGGGGMLAALGIVSALLERKTSGQGQIVDAAMIDGIALLSTFIHGMRAVGQWNDEPGTNLLDSGAPFYDVYETADGRYVAVGTIEPQFYAELLRLLELDPVEFPQWDATAWPHMRKRFAEVFRTSSRDSWAARLEGTDSCASPVYTLAEATRHPHNQSRGTFGDHGGWLRPAAAPRFSRTPASTHPDHGAAEDDPAADTVLAGLMDRWGVRDHPAA